MVVRHKVHKGRTLDFKWVNYTHAKSLIQWTVGRVGLRLFIPLVYYTLDKQLLSKKLINKHTTGLMFFISTRPFSILCTRPSHLSRLILSYLTISGSNIRSVMHQATDPYATGRTSVLCSSYLSGVFLLPIVTLLHVSSPILLSLLNWNPRQIQLSTVSKCFPFTSSLWFVGLTPDK